jgi:hypothetical protein
MQEYVERFLSLRCAGDVLNITGRMHEPEKEITESMGIIKHLKKIVLPEKMKYTVIDLCAGNALTSILAVHMLPVKDAVAIDLKKRKGHYENAKRFTYIEGDIRVSLLGHNTQDVIFISVHPCKTADMIIDMFNSYMDVKYLIMMPCCNGSYQDIVGYGWLHETKKVSAYDLWTLHLANNIQNSDVKIITDNNILSPKRNIIIAHKKDVNKCHL